MTASALDTLGVGESPLRLEWDPDTLPVTLTSRLWGAPPVPQAALQAQGRPQWGRMWLSPGLPVLDVSRVTGALTLWWRLWNLVPHLLLPSAPQPGGILGMGFLKEAPTQCLSFL